MDDLSERGLNDWLDTTRDILNERGLDYGDPRDLLLRHYKICRALGIQLRDPADLALVLIALKLSRLVESPMREDTYIDLIGYSTILARTRFTDWSDFGAFEEY